MMILLGALVVSALLVALVVHLNRRAPHLPLLTDEGALAHLERELGLERAPSGADAKVLTRHVGHPQGLRLELRVEQHTQQLRQDLRLIARVALDSEACAGVTLSSRHGALLPREALMTAELLADWPIIHGFELDFERRFTTRGPARGVALTLWIDARERLTALMPSAQAPDEAGWDDLMIHDQTLIACKRLQDQAPMMILAAVEDLLQAADALRCAMLHEHARLQTMLKHETMPGLRLVAALTLARELPGQRDATLETLLNSQDPLLRLAHLSASPQDWTPTQRLALLTQVMQAPIDLKRQSLLMEHLAREHGLELLHSDAQTPQAKALLLHELLKSPPPGLADALGQLLERDGPIVREFLLVELAQAAQGLEGLEPVLLTHMRSLRTRPDATASELELTLDALALVASAACVEPLHALLEQRMSFEASRRVVLLLGQRQDAHSARRLGALAASLRQGEPPLEAQQLLQLIDKTLQQLMAHHGAASQGGLSLSAPGEEAGALSLSAQQGGELTLNPPSPPDPAP